MTPREMLRVLSKSGNSVCEIPGRCGLTGVEAVGGAAVPPQLNAIRWLVVAPSLASVNSRSEDVP
jgi:hypothetical protein